MRCRFCGREFPGAIYSSDECIGGDTEVCRDKCARQRDDLRRQDERIAALEKLICDADSWMSLLWYRGKPNGLDARMAIEKVLADLRKFANESEAGRSKIGELPKKQPLDSTSKGSAYDLYE